MAVQSVCLLSADIEKIFDCTFNFLNKHFHSLLSTQTTEESEGGIPGRCEIQCAGLCEGAHSTDELSQLQFVNSTTIDDEPGGG